MPPAALTAPTAEKPVTERQFYVPFDKLDKVFEQNGRGVFLPFEDYQQLWQELTARRTAENQPLAPQAASLTSGTYTAKAEGETLLIDAVLSAQSHRDGWSQIFLGGVNLAVASAETGDAILSATSKGLTLMLPKKGVYPIKLQFAAKITTESGRQSLHLNLPPAAVSNFTAVLPGKNLDFEVQPGMPFSSREVGDNTELSFFSDGTEAIHVFWKRQEEGVKLTPLILADVKVTARLQPGAFRTDAAISYRILRAPTQSFDIQLPADHELLNVIGDNVREWKIEEAKDGQPRRLNVQLHTPVKKDYQLLLELERQLPALPAKVSVPLDLALNVARQNGRVLVLADPEIQVVPQPGAGVTQQTLNEAEQAGKQGRLEPIGAYRYLNLPAELNLSLELAKAQIDARSFTVVDVEPDQARLRGRLELDIKRLGIYELRLQIPEGWSQLEATGDAIDDFSTVKEGDKSFMRLKFKSQQRDKVIVELTAWRTRAAADDLTLPLFQIPDARRHDAHLGLRVHPSLEMNTKDAGDLRSEDIGELPDFNDEVQQQASAANSDDGGEATMAFRYRESAAKPALLSFKQREPQVNVDVRTLAEVKEQVTRYTWTFQFNVLYAGIDRFYLAVPKEVAKSIRLQDPAVKEINRNFDYKAPAGTAEPEKLEGYDVWEVTLRDRKQGEFSLTADFSDVGARIAEGKESVIKLPVVRLLGVFQENGQIAVVKDGNLELSNAEPANLEEIDPKELEEPLARDGIFLAYKQRRQPIALSLTATKNSYLAVPEAIITHAELNYAVGTDTGMTCEAIYWLRNNSLQFLTLTLPEGGRLISDISVDGQMQQPLKRPGAEQLLVRLPSGGDHASRSFPARFVFEMPASSSARKMDVEGKFRVLIPQIEGLSVLQSRVKLYLPRDFVYTGFDGLMTAPPEEQGWSRWMRDWNTLLPHLGPNPTGMGQAVHPVFPEAKQAGSGGLDFKLPQDGQVRTLERLNAPSEIVVSFRSKLANQVYQGIVFFLMLCAGLWFLLRPARERTFYVMAVIGMLVLAGLMQSASAGIPKAGALGGLLAMAAWFLMGAIPRLKFFVLQKALRLRARFARKPAVAAGTIEDDNK